MRPDPNDGFSVEKYWDDRYEDSQGADSVECPDCMGSGLQYFSECCGTDIINNKCTECNQECEVEKESCTNCKGEGEIEE